MGRAFGARGARGRGDGTSWSVRAETWLLERPQMDTD